MTKHRALLTVLALVGPLALALGAQRLPSRLGGPVGPPPKPGTPAPNKPGAPAPAAATRPAGPEKVVPFKPGEMLTYDVSWSDTLTAGSATLTVRDKRTSFGSTAYYLVAEGQPTSLLSKLYAVYYKADTLVDAYTLFPQRGSVFSQENGRQRMKETKFDQAKRAATFQMRTATTMTQDQALPGPTHDGLSALTAMRTMTFAPGASSSFAVADSGYLYRVTLNVGAKETIPTGLGGLPAWKIVPAIRDSRGQVVGRGMAVWISDDARRLPVRIQAQLPVGTFVLTLKDAR
ncbi:hypothetical protein LuPra_04957 [Luteitalea pratensis]|uniref:DUF3108 domain-containing protein n=1 Tax=Luteitalea pratensis TaxID=1855912 RepID=A0A143PV87_LUTPR|nr:DUF3108 domain-containing protein [Luteitalea pratensis]AMY11699.1 hypothetical protein LuPra_04957 [Luteitalea pratensis]